MAATIYTDASSKVKPPVGSEEAPFRTIGEALDLASPGDVVQVAPGRYEERVTLKAGVALQGGGAPSTVIDVSDLSPEGVAVVCADDALIAGFRIIDPSPLQNGTGAAIDCSSGGAPEIADNQIEVPERSAIVLGNESQAWIHHNVIRGGPSIPGLLLGSIAGAGRPLIEGNEIASNGVAISLGHSAVGEVRLRRNRVRGRALVTSGESVEAVVSENLFLPSRGALPKLGGLVLVNEFDNSLIVANNTFFETSGIQLEAGDATIANNLLVNGGAGIELEVGATAEVRSNDVFGNRAGIMGAPTDYVGIEDQTGSNGNLSVAPDFVDAFLEDFRLRPASPALDTGSEELEDVVSSEDFDGDPRVVDGDGDDEEVVDMGAQEFQPDEELPLPALPIEVDVLPGKSPNELKFGKVAKGNGKVAIAILSDDELDAPDDVDVASLILDREPVLRCRAKDVDRDARRDLVCSFPLRGISVADWPIFVPPACVRGLTHGGRKLLGCDEVEIVP